MISEAALGFLTELLATPGPSGFEAAPARRWRKEAESFAAQVRSDVSGNSYATLTGDAAPGVAPLMLAGHIDEIGLMVVHIDDQGFLWFDPIGGWDPQVFVGQRVILLGKDGPVTGVIGRIAIHLLEKEAREKVIRPQDLWIDIGASSREDAAGRVRVGDPGVLAAPVERFPNGRLVSRSLDNRIGAFVVLEALRRLQNDRLAVPVTAVATSHEEICYASGGGARTSAAGLEPVAAIAVDVTHATDTPGVEKKRHGQVTLGGGPVLTRGAVLNPRLFELLVETAESEGIPYIVKGVARDTGTDADNIVGALRGVATALVSVPLRYMHSPNELVDLEDLDRTAALLAAFARRLPPAPDLVSR